MNDNGDDNVTYLNLKPKNSDDTLNYFIQGASQHAAYQDGEAFARSCMNGILMALDKKIGGLKDTHHSDAAVVAVLIVGMFMRQVGVDSPETQLLDDIRDGLTVNKGEE